MNVANTLSSFSLSALNKSRNVIFWLSTRVKSIVDEVTQMKDRDDLHNILTTYLPWWKLKTLRTFFERNPSAWWDFIRKLNKYKKTKDWDDRSLYVDEHHIADVLETLLIRGRREDTWAWLIHELRAGIQNPQLLRFASGQPSILDNSWYSFSTLDKKTRGESIEKLIISWLIKNIDDCNTENAPEYFRKVFPRLQYYLSKIFWLKIESGNRIQTIKDLVGFLQKMFSNPDKVEDAWMIIQSFQAWPRVNEIEELCESAKEDITKMDNAFNKVWIKIGKIVTEQHITGTTLYHSELFMWEKKYNISWRVKTPESILQKMWQKSQYNNVDAMRDIIGLNVIYPDGTSEEEKRELLQVFSNLMPNYGYILKNKWAIKSSEWLTENLDKKPMAIKEEKSEMTHENFSNMSLSGYMKLWKNPYGAEIQFMSESEALSKKLDDPYYKLRWALDAFFRWPKYRHPSALYNFIQTRVSVPYLESLWCTNFGDLFWKLIVDGYLRAYRFPNKKHFFFGVKWKEDAVHAIFPNAHHIESVWWESIWYEDLRNYVRNDYRMMNNDELTKAKTSLPPPFPDWWNQDDDPFGQW
jgi:Region found in RelA / SpoT proteins